MPAPSGHTATGSPSASPVMALASKWSTSPGNVGMGAGGTMVSVVPASSTMIFVWANSPALRTPNVPS